jgi:hypothetical protein
VVFHAFSISSTESSGFAGDHKHNVRHQITARLVNLQRMPATDLGPLQMRQRTLGGVSPTMRSRHPPLPAEVAREDQVLLGQISNDAALELPEALGMSGKIRPVFRYPLFFDQAAGRLALLADTH